MSSTLRQIVELQALPASELQDRWRTLFGTEPPVGPRRFLVKRLAYRLQELTHGGLTQTLRTRMVEIAQEAGLDQEASLPDRRTRTTARKRRRPPAGTRLIRWWHGRRYEAIVAAAGFEFEGRLYRSLTAVVYAITGTHWSGNRFFGISPSREEGRK